MSRYSYWKDVAKQYRRHPLGTAALAVLGLFIIIALYAPLLASSKPLFVIYEGTWYSPLARYLFYPNYFTKHLDIFFNLMMITFPLLILVSWLPCRRGYLAMGIIFLQLAAFFFLLFNPIKDPAVSPELNKQRQSQVQQFLEQAKNPEAPIPQPFRTWSFDLAHMTPYAQLNMLVAYRLEHEHDEQLKTLTNSSHFESRWQQNQLLLQQQIESAEGILKKNQERYLQLQKTLAHGTLNPQQRRQILSYEETATKKAWLTDRQFWLNNESGKLEAMTMPLIRPFHWEDDAGGDQSLNHVLPWYELTRTNRKDLVAALIFGIRISLVVGITSVALAFLIGLPIGSLAGFYGGRFDIVVCRLIEIWESMPLFFMLLLVVAITQSKSIFLVITVIGLFGWIPFCRYTRGEFFKQRNLPYVEACHSLGFSHARTIFFHILPNAIPPLLTLMPFSIMGAMTSEAALSFLGLGEEGSCSWGVLMDEGRNAFPGESYLLWPPAILLTMLLISIALVGDALRDALDPKLHHSD
jgi:peptide/nickel transport system permease protein